MAGMPVAVIIEASGLFQNTMQLDAARAHVLDVRLRRFVAVFERTFFLRLAPEDLVVPVGVERRVNVDQIDTRLRQLAELVEIIAAINDPRIDQRRSFGGFCHPGES